MPLHLAASSHVELCVPCGVMNASIPAWKRNGSRCDDADIKIFLSQPCCSEFRKQRSTLGFIAAFLNTWIAVLVSYRKTVYSFRVSPSSVYSAFSIRLLRNKFCTILSDTSMLWSGGSGKRLGSLMECAGCCLVVSLKFSVGELCEFMIG